MNILAIDTSGPSAGVAISDNGLLRCEATVQNKLTHSVNIMPMVEESLKHSDLQLQHIDLFAAVVGPGSFTGVRIGVAALKGMAQALNRPCIAVNALEALAHGVWAPDTLICPIRDARAQQVYGAAFQDGRRLMEDVVLKLPQYLVRVDGLADKLLFVGDGVEPLRNLIAGALGGRAQFLPPHLNLLRAGAAAHLAFRDRAGAISAAELMPFYLRKPQAEREREQRGG